MTHLTCFDVADYLLFKIDEEAGDTISNLKLQKLVYYAQGFSLALNHEPLFDENLTAWQHGPVCIPLYNKYKEYGAGAIAVPAELELDKFSKEDQELLDEVYEVYGQFSAWKLRNMTREEAPWKETPINGVINHDVMERFFKGRLINEDD